MVSKRRVRWNACGRKVAYATHEDANRALFAMRRKYPGNEWLSVYRCKWCHQFHLGHLPAFVPLYANGFSGAKPDEGRWGGGLFRPVEFFRVRNPLKTHSLEPSEALQLLFPLVHPYGNCR